jgi:hypothetical protein
MKQQLGAQWFKDKTKDGPLEYGGNNDSRIWVPEGNVLYGKSAGLPMSMAIMP